MNEERTLWEAEQMNKGAIIDHESYNDLMETYAEDSYAEPRQVENYEEFLEEFNRIKSISPGEPSYGQQLRNTLISAWEGIWENS